MSWSSRSGRSRSTPSRSGYGAGQPRLVPGIIPNEFVFHAGAAHARKGPGAG
jgi:hypothetical protein